MFKDNILKLLSIINFFIILVLLTIILSTKSVSAYEISIYGAYPFYFWGLVILSLLIGIIIMIKCYLNEKESNMWIFGFLGILLTNIVLLSLPLIRNYFMFGRGDVLTHIGYMKNILITGYVGSNMYPILHILGVDTFLISNIGLNRVTMMFPLFFSVFYSISFYILFKKVFENKKDIILGMVPASLLLLSTFQTLFAPNAEALLLIPFFLYCYFNSRKSDNEYAFTIITIILALLLTFLHPLVSISVIFILLLIEVSSFIYSKYSKNNSKLRNPYTLITIMAIIFLMWQSYAYLIVQNLKRVFKWFIEESGQSQLQNYSSTLAYGKPNLLDLICTVLNTYGSWIIVSLIALVTILYLVKNKNRLNFVNIFSSLGFIFFIFWSFLTLSFVYIFGFSRTYALAILIAIFLVFTFLKIILSTKNKTKKKVKTMFLCLIFIPLIFFSTFNLYYSPPIKTPNEQVTASEYVGMQTFFEIRDDNFLVYEFGLSQQRFFDGIYGTYDKNLTTSNKLNIDNKNLKFTNTTPIDHFGYNNYSSVINYYNQTSYLLINDLGKETYPILYPHYKDKWRFTPYDFKKLNNDSGLSLVYDNANLEIYIIRS